MSDPQDKLLELIQSEPRAKILWEMWQTLDSAPLQAARIMRTFQEAGKMVDVVLAELPAKFKELETATAKADLAREGFIADIRRFRNESVTETQEALRAVKEIQATLADINADTFVAKANRVIDVCERLGKAKRDGTFDLLKRLL